jgi:hypothetical protein
MSRSSHCTNQPTCRQPTNSSNPPQVGSAQRIATMQMKEADSGKKGKRKGQGGDEDEGARGFMASGGKKGRR